MVPRDFISNRREGKRARQRRDRERVGVRGRALRKDRDSIDNKIVREIINMWCKCWID
jgi:hypothetical protein